ncbi:MAG TPA: hypothetical protein VGL58_08910 [Caulobacteraceae bacterium]
MQSWWASLDKARQMMIAALVVMFLSEFLEYSGGRTVVNSIPIYGSGGGDYVANVSANSTQHVAGANGWGYHPLAILILGAIAVVFGLNLKLPPPWHAWRYRIAFVGLVFCVLPVNLADGPGLGLFLGFAALAIGALAWRMGGRPVVEAPAAPATPQ